jgi:hypothetical protein
MTRWRWLDHPISPLDPIQPDGPQYEEGKLPPFFVLLLWDGNALRGPMRFNSQIEADSYLQMQPGVTQYMVLPKPL